MGKLVARSHHEPFKPVTRIHAVAYGIFQIVILGGSVGRFALPMRLAVDKGFHLSAVHGKEFDLSWTSQHGHSGGLNDIQVIALDPDRINAVRNLQGQGVLVRLH